MNFNSEWKTVEQSADFIYNDWGKSNETINGFNLNSFIIIRNWLSYARIIGDDSAKQITDEELKCNSFLYELIMKSGKV